MKTWRERITELEAAGWSLTQIAQEIGLSLPALSDVKQGRTQQPRANAAMKLDELHRRFCAETKPTKKAA